MEETVTKVTIGFLVRAPLSSPMQQPVRAPSQGPFLTPLLAPLEGPILAIWSPWPEG